uniref:MARVEL domain-containing protein n=1 Tax=Strigamia maritima TaxID=126957 RepID=T1IX72_STRMM
MGSPSLEIDWIKKPIGYLQLISFILCMVILGAYYFNHASTDSNFIEIIIGSTFFILLYYILAYFVGERDVEEFSIEGMVFAVAHGIFNVIAGILILVRDGNTSDQYYIAAVCLIIVFILFIIIAVFLYKNR